MILIPIHNRVAAIFFAGALALLTASLPAGAEPLPAGATRLAQSAPLPTTSAKPAALRPRNAATTAAALRGYQRALDQLATGHISEARALTEDARRRYGDAPELNLLLGYLLQRENRPDVARERLSRVAPTSSLAAAYVAQLTANEEGSATPDKTVGDEMAGRDGVPPENPGDDLVIIAGTAASLRQGDKNLAELERSLAMRVNTERARAGLGSLTFDETLAGVARAHSADMRDRNYFAHQSPNNSLREPLDRYRAIFQTTPSVIAENIFRSWGAPRTLGEREISEAHNSLMNSPGHRSNILLPRVTRIGIGLIINANGDLWVTQMFSRP